MRSRKKCFEQEAFTKLQLAYLLTYYNAIGIAALVNGLIDDFAITRVDFTRNEQFGNILTMDVKTNCRRTD